MTSRVFMGLTVFSIYKEMYSRAAIDMEMLVSAQTLTLMSFRKKCFKVLEISTLLYTFENTTNLLK